MKIMSDVRFILFGTGHVAVAVADALYEAGLVPTLIVTSPDAPAGRGKVLTPSAISSWASSHGIEMLKPQKIDTGAVEEIRAILSSRSVTVGVVVDYGKILPDALLDLFPRGILNMHPSLLPRLRGPSPIRSAILTDEKNTGVTVMLVDAELDHGPIVAQKKVTIENWPPRGRDLDVLLAREGAKLMAEMLPLWNAGEIQPQVQNHDVATLCYEITKKDAELDLNGDAYANLLKIRAYDEWPGAYTFFEKNGAPLRVRIIDAHIEGKKLVLDTVRPEGKNDMPYADFVRSGATYRPHTAD
jgi:methionyl-tRNA formyltransferase